MAITTREGDLRLMLPGGPMYHPDMPLAHQFCSGVGIELGAAAHNSFNLPGSINVAPFSDDPNHPDYRDFLYYQAHQVELCGRYAVIDLTGEADAIPVGDKSQDYVISSHVIEHLPNLVDAFLEWNRVLKPGGIIFMIFPKRDALPEDVGRPITPLSHFIEDHALKRTAQSHILDDKVTLRGHYHVFTVGSMIELIHWSNLYVKLSWRIEAIEESDSKVGNGHTMVCRYAPASGLRTTLKRILKG